MVKLIPGESVEAGEPVTPEVPAPEIPTPVSAASNNDYSSVQMMEDYVDHFLTILAANRDFRITHDRISGEIQMPDPAIIKPYCPYMFFDPGFRVNIRPFTRDEYLQVLSQTSPDLAELINVTDLKESLPGTIGRSLRDGETLNENGLAPLGLEEERGRRASSDFSNYSEYTFVIKETRFLSYFMEHGEFLRAYLSHLPRSETTVPMLNFWRGVNQSRTNYHEHKLQNFRRPEKLFEPSNLLRYVKETGDTRIRGMLAEYQEIITASNLKDTLYAKLRKVHPERTAHGKIN
jgi:hypothetical protein